MGADWTVRTLLDAMPARGARPAAVAFSEAGRTSRAYGDLAADAEALAVGLLAAGAQPGERIYLVAPNGIDWITVYLGALAAGLVVVPLDHLAQVSEIEQIGAAAPPRLVFAGADRIDDVREALPSADRFVIGAERAGDAPSWRSLRADGPAAARPLDPDAVALLLQTSGTTGAAKLFTLRARNLGANVLPLAASGLAGADDRLVLPLPMHHVYPQVVGVLSALTVGATIVLPEAVTGPTLLAALQAERATGIIGVPRLYDALLAGIEDAIRRRSRLAHRLFGLALSASAAARRRTGRNVGKLLFAGIRHRLSPDLRLLVSGGARLDPATTWKLSGLGFNVRSGYGLAETASTHTANTPGRDRLGTEGKPLGDGEMRINEPDEEGIGEIRLRGPNVFDGYLDPERTREAFTEDGWFRSGDLGRIDADGFLSVTGRVKETIVLGGGKKIVPEDLEKVYAQSPFIAEMAILESEGRLVALIRADAAAVTAAGYVRADGPIRMALAEAARPLPSHQHLAGFALVRDPLPRTRLGKLRRFLLPELYRDAKAGVAAGAARPAEADEALLRAPRAAEAWRLLQERYRGRLTSAEDYLALDLGIDSLEWLNLSLELEQRLGIDLAGADLGALVTVRGLLEAVAGARAGAPAAPAAAEPWMQPAKPWQRRLANMLTGLNRVLVRALFRLRVEGIEHLPSSGPFAITCNHLSYLDAFVLAAGLPSDTLRRTHWGAAERTLPAAERLRWLYVALNVFPMEEAAPTVGLACARRALDEDEIMTVFPEAWRSPDGHLQPFLPGVGHLLGGTDIPVVPACLHGTFEALPRHRRWPRLVPLRLRFGPPVSPADLEARGQGATPAERIADALHDVIAALCGPPEAAAETSKAPTASPS